MISQSSISRLPFRVGLLNQASRVFGPRSDSRPFDFKSLAQISQSYNAFQGLPESVNQAPMLVNASSRFLGSLGKSLGLLKVDDNLSPASALNFRSDIHSACPKEFEKGRNNMPMNFPRGDTRENGWDRSEGPQFSRFVVERDADIVHIKLMRNNAFVTVTDSKGNKKIGASSGSVLTKVSRYAAESVAEHVGRLAKNMGLKSFVVKVNGFTYFKKKKQAILSFRDGYTNSRSDSNPIVYIEDTTRRAHNGCRLRKKRRV